MKIILDYDESKECACLTLPKNVSEEFEDIYNVLGYDTPLIRHLSKLMGDSITTILSTITNKNLPVKSWVIKKGEF